MLEEYLADIMGERLDVFLARLSGQSRSRVQAAIQAGAASVNGKPQKANYRLCAGDGVTLILEEPKTLDVIGEDIPLDIVYQDADVLVVNKPQGMVVHPAPGNESGTLVNAIIHTIDDLSGIGGVLRPGIVHRIDKLTSGLIVVAKNDAAHIDLCRQLKAHTAKRAYIAIVEGNIKEDSGTVDAPIGRHPNDRKRMAVVDKGREAITHWSVLLRTGQYTLIEARLETGRTHQIRVHMKHIKHPVAGDEVYGHRALGLNGQALHAYKLEFEHPRTHEHMCFSAKAPAHFIKALRLAGFEEAGEHEAFKLFSL